MFPAAGRQARVLTVRKVMARSQCREGTVGGDAAAGLSEEADSCREMGTKGM